MATEKIFVQIDNDKIELTGEAKAEFIADREATKAESLLLETEQAAKKQLRETAIRQLAQTANLSEEQIETLLGGI